MEKYRKFSDAKYGINPFVPNKTKTTSPVIKYTLGLVLLTVRLPIVLCLFASLFVYHSIIKKCIVVKSLAKVITSLVELVVYKIIALCFGFFGYKTIPKLDTKESNRPKLDSGHIILCNHTHPLDFLFFEQVCSPTFVKLFTKTSSSGEKEVLAMPLEFTSLLKYFFTSTFHYPTPINGDSSPDFAVKIAELAENYHQNKQGPLVIFFEGAITNGKGVLEINEALAYDIYEYQKQNTRETVVTAFTYDDNADASVKNPIISSLSLMMNLTNHATIKLSPITKLPIQKKDMPRTIYDIYENFHGMPKMALRSEDYQAFLEYWRATQKKNYVNKEKDQ